MLDLMTPAKAPMVIPDIPMISSQQSEDSVIISREAFDTRTLVRQSSIREA